MGGVFFCKKKWTFPQRRVHYVQYQYFFISHFTYLGGCMHPTHPLPTGLLLLYGKSKAGLQSQTNNK